MRCIKSQEELLALHTAGDGFIYNDYAQTGASGRQHNVLHRASCPWILRSRATIPKYYAASLREAEGWLDTHRGQEGAGWKRCRNCHTRSEPPQTPPGQTVQRKRTASHYQSTPRELQSVADAPYLVQTKQTTSGKVVEAWSAQRLPYEPRGWLLGFRNDLRAALRPLAAAPDQLLGAVYASEHKGFFDVENVLFYNVGPAFLKGAGRYGVRYERAYQVPLPQQPLAWSAGHYHRYYVDAAAGRLAHWGTGAVLASLHAETRERADLFDCTLLWFLLKSRGHVAAFRQATDQPFILRVQITTPPAAATAATDLLKPVSDGIVSALHRHNGENEEEICRRLAGRTHSAPATLRAFLNDETTAVLGTRTLLWPFRNGVQWNPADDLCVAAELVVRQSAGQEHYIVRGELLAAEHAGAAA